jgi:hypothetical protein
MIERVKFVALDIALLLDPELDALCRRLNSAKGAEPFSDFRKQTNYPHVTLAMGVFREGEIPAILKELVLLRPQLPVRLSVTELYCKVSEQIGQEYQLMIERDSAFNVFYNDFRERINPYFTSLPASQNMFVVDKDEVWNPNTTQWVDGFKHKRPHDYKPHISLKCRNASLDVPLPIEGRGIQIVIAQIGNYCSCRTLLREVHR